MKSLLTISFLISTVALAKPGITPIDDGEFNMDGAACWLQDVKENTILYYDYKKANIKIDSKIISLSPGQLIKKSSFFDCGKNYEFKSTDNAVTVLVEMQKSKKQDCKGKLTVNTIKGKTILNDLVSKCGE